MNSGRLGVLFGARCHLSVCPSGRPAAGRRRSSVYGTPLTRRQAQPERHLAGHEHGPLGSGAAFGRGGHARGPQRRRGRAIPYQPAALAKRNENSQTARRSIRCTSATCPACRAITYMPFPFQITQTPKHVVLTYEYAHAHAHHLYGRQRRTCRRSTSGWATRAARWESDTLVVDVTHFNDRTWFDKAGNFHSDALHVVERYTPLEAGPRCTTRRRSRIRRCLRGPGRSACRSIAAAEKNLQILDYDCVDFFWRRMPSGR